MNGRTESTSVPPSITIDNVQVTEIGKNTMTLSIKISGENINQKPVKTKALQDTGAGGKFIDQNFVWNQNIKMKDLEHPIEVFNVDGAPNKQGTTTKYTQLDLTINRCTRPHNLFVTGLGKQEDILGSNRTTQKLIGRNAPLLGKKNRTTANRLQNLWLKKKPTQKIGRTTPSIRLKNWMMKNFKMQF